MWKMNEPGTIGKTHLRCATHLTHVFFKFCVVGTWNCNHTTFASKPETGMTMGICKTTAIQTDLGRLGNILVYSGIFRNFCELGIMRIRSIFGTQLHLEPWHIKDRGILRARDTFRTLANSGHWYIHSCGIFRTLVY